MQRPKYNLAYVVSNSLRYGLNLGKAKIYAFSTHMHVVKVESNVLVDTPSSRPQHLGAVALLECFGFKPMTIINLQP